MWQHLLTCFVKKLYPQMRAPAKIFLAEPDKAGISRWWNIKIQIYHLMFCASLTKHLKLNVVQSKVHSPILKDRAPASTGRFILGSS